MLRTISTLLLLATIGAQLGAQSKTEPALLETALLQEDWPAVLEALQAFPASDSTPMAFVKAHALLATNRNNESFCLFLNLDNDEDEQRWKEWTLAFAAAHPKHAVAHYFLGDAWARQSDWNLALKAFAQSIEMSPNHHLTLNARGVVFAALRDYDRALVDFEHAASLRPTFADAFASRGSLFLQRSGPAAGAQKAFQRALRLSPDFGLSLMWDGFVETIRDDWEQGKKKVEAAALKSGCIGLLIAQDLLRVSDWLDQPTKPQLASLNPEEAGTMLNREFMNVGKRDPFAVGRALSITAQHPEFAKKTQLFLTDMSRRSPQMNSFIGQGISNFVTQTERKNSILGFAQGITLSGGVNASFGNSLKLGGNLGASLNLDKAFELGQHKLSDQLNLGRQMQMSVPAAKDQIGGVTTNLLRARVDKGNWPPLARYGLVYDVDAQATTSGSR